MVQDGCRMKGLEPQSQGCPSGQGHMEQRVWTRPLGSQDEGQLGELNPGEQPGVEEVGLATWGGAGWGELGEGLSVLYFGDLSADRSTYFLLLPPREVKPDKKSPPAMDCYTHTAIGVPSN